MTAWNKELSQHLLSRAGFGGDVKLRDHFVKLGISEAVNALFPPDNYSSASSPDLSSVREMEEQAVRILRQPGARQKLRETEEGKELLQKFQQANRQGIIAITGWWVDEMLRTPYPLLEKMTLFWHNHFTSSFMDVKRANFLWKQNDLLRKNALGSFRTLLLETAKDPAMLEYLDNSQNRKEHPNENYARELCELFTLGEGNYTDQDVKEAARAFTGWTHNPQGEFIFRPAWHDNGEKTFLGRRGNFNGEDIIEILLEEKETSRFLTRKFLRFFITEEPNSQMIEKFADIFRKGDLEVKPLLKSMFTSEEFYSDQNRGNLVKSPVDFVIGTLRLMRINFPRPEILWGFMGLMGQRLLDPPTVAGWKGGKNWLSSSTLTLRNDFIRALITGEIPNISPRGKVKNRAKQIKLPRPPFVPENVLPQEAFSNPTNAVIHTVDHFIGRELSPDRLQPLFKFAQDAFLQEKEEASALRRITYLVLSMPEYQLC